MKLKHIPLLLLVLTCCPACQNKKASATKEIPSEATYTNPLLAVGAEPWAVFHEGKYYYTQGAENKIILWETNDITDLEHAARKEVWIPKEISNSYHLWGPEIHRIDGKWYVYFAADDGNMDNHHIYVIENSWPKRRTNAETQCIYIARMENPWTLSSDRVMIAEPEYEWERQWISPDGSKTAYPIHVNESPQFFESKNKDKVLIYYCASGSWTPYYCIGLLTADAGSDLTNAASWKKQDTPVFEQQPEDSVFGPGSPSFVPTPDEKEWYMLYHARKIPNDAPGATDSRSPRLQKISWDANGMPVLGKPCKEGTQIK